MGVVDELVRAREAYDRHEWVAAYDGLSDLSPAELTADDFGRLAMAAFLRGRPNDCIQALQRAHAAQLAGGDVAGAVRSAFWLTMVLLENGEAAVAGGWVARARRLLTSARAVRMVNRTSGALLAAGALVGSLPLVILYSFSANQVATWPIEGWTLDWYREVRQDDELIDVQVCGQNSDIILATHEGMAIRFPESDVREMGRATTGVRAATPSMRCRAGWTKVSIR